MSRRMHCLTYEDNAPLLFDTEQEALEYQKEMNESDEHEFHAGPFPIDLPPDPQALSDRELATVIAAMWDWREAVEDDRDYPTQESFLQIPEIDKLLERLGPSPLLKQ